MQLGLKLGTVNTAIESYLYLKNIKFYDFFRIEGNAALRNRTKGLRLCS